MSDRVLRQAERRYDAERTTEALADLWLARMRAGIVSRHAIELLASFWVPAALKIRESPYQWSRSLKLLRVDKVYRELAQFPELEAVRIETRRDPADLRQILMALATLPHLRELRLGNQLLDRSLVQAIGSLGSLRRLNFGLCEFPPADCLDRASFDRLTSLEELELDACYGFGDEHLGMLESIRSLRSLRLKMQHQVSHHGLEHLVHFPSLEECCLDWCALLQDPTVEVLSACPRMKRIILRGITGDLGLRDIYRCMQLEELEIDDGRNIVTNEGMQSIASVVPLKALHLRVPRVTTRGVEALTKGFTLETVSIICGPRVGNGAVKALTSPLRLKSLSLTGKHKIDERALKYLKEARSLTNLELGTGDRIPAKAFEELQEAIGPQLRIIDLDYLRAQKNRPTR